MCAMENFRIENRPRWWKDREALAYSLALIKLVRWAFSRINYTIIKWNIRINKFEELKKTPRTEMSFWFEVPVYNAPWGKIYLKQKLRFHWQQCVNWWNCSIRKIDRRLVANKYKLKILWSKVHSREFLTARNSNFHPIQYCSPATSPTTISTRSFILRCSLDCLCGQFLLEQGSLVLIVTSPEEITYLLATFAWTGNKMF